ncbi:MAG TPA: MogA/MoaB family molybdenum cofactor biosynthesis protein, partial [Nitrospiraceae bacterium]|nr:MogA/MoaB family molybdenum cofactor biosynthesis protein [Nitrospiraceae bacterium]
MLQVAVIVVSSKIATGSEGDRGRAALEQMVGEIPGRLAVYEVVPDDRRAVAERLASLADAGQADVILTIGGTGVRPTDWAPEATRDVVDKEIPGIGEAMRQESVKKVKTAMLSRGTAGIRGGALIVNLPGSPRGAKDNLSVILPILEHTVEKIHK